MTAIQITCDNCGAKYRLPENFTGSTSKCQKCGSVIEVAKQRASATSPAGATPAAAAKPAAAARPAVDRSREAPRPAERRPSAAVHEVPRASKAAGEADRKRERRARSERPAKKTSSMPLVLGGVGVLAIIVVVVLVKSFG